MKIVAAVALAFLINGESGFTQEAPPAEQKRPFFLPKSPVAAAYVLGRLSNQELLEAPRSEFVYVAILKRAGLERKHRLEALKGLAEIRSTSILTELLAAIKELDSKGGESLPVLADLGGLLLQRKAEDLLELRAESEALAADSEVPRTRQVGYAALATADGSIEKSWARADQSASGLIDLILAVPLIRDSQIRAAADGRVRPLLKRADAPELRRASIRAVAFIPGREAETFAALAELIGSGIEIDASISSLQRLPQSAWPRPAIEPLVNKLLAHMRTVPTADRTETPFLNAVQFATELASLLPQETAAPIKRFLGDLGVRVIVIRTVPEQMLYDKRLIVVQAGKPVEIILVNDDAMPHNLVIVRPGAVEEIGTAAEKMRPNEDSEGRLYIPDSSKVLYATKMLNSGETAKLSFIAPNEEGEYGYVCTFPGHWRRMFGTLVVVNDVEAYLASASALEAPVMTEWTIGDFESDLAALESGRNTENGRELFTSLACAQCHKLGDEGYGFGPELTGVLERWKGDRASVLREILEPSKTIADGYRNHVFETDDGESLSGLVLKEEAESVTLQSGPSAALIQRIQKSSIETRDIQSSSLMPMGLLSAASKEDVLDLLAYILGQQGN